MPTLNGISYSQLHDGSGQLTCDDKGAAQMRIKVAWADAIPMADALYGYVDINGNGELIIVEPARLAESPNLVVVGVDREPCGKPIGVSTWQNAILTVRFGTRPYEPTDLFEESLDFSGEVIEVPADNVVFEGTSDAPPEDLRITVATATYTVTCYRMPQMPAALIASYLNTVNSAAFKGVPHGRTIQQPGVAQLINTPDNGINFAPGHSLFVGANASRRTSTFGRQNWQVAFKFVWSPLFDHRAEFDPSSNTFKLVTINGGYKYQSADHNRMFATQASSGITLLS